MNLGQFDKKFLKSIENEVADDQENTNTVDEKGRLAINSLPTSVVKFLKISRQQKSMCRLLITFANSLDPDQTQHNVGPDLDPICLTLWWHC